MNTCSPPTGYLMENDTRPAGGKEPPGRLFVTLAAAVAMVAALSLVPWSRLTAGFLKDFNLLEDLAGEMSALPGEAGDEAIDPALIAAQPATATQMPLYASPESPKNTPVLRRDATIEPTIRPVGAFLPATK